MFSLSDSLTNCTVRGSWMVLEKAYGPGDGDGA
jgi:hypothetical protein